MTEPREEDWNTLERQWRQSEHPAPSADDIRKRLRRKRTRLAATWTLDGLLAAGLVALMVHEAVTAPGPRTWVLVSALAVFLVIALAFTVANRRGLWVTESSDLEAYVRHGLEHCRRRLRTIRFAWWLYAAEVIFIGGYGIGVGLSAGAWLVVGAVLGGFAIVMAAWSAWFRRRVLAERDYLEALTLDEDR